MNATVLAATDANALTQWLNAHDFALRERAQSWVQRYIDKKWVFTAFRYARPDVASREGGEHAESQTGRLSFKTDTLRGSSPSRLETLGLRSLRLRSSPTSLIAPKRAQRKMLYFEQRRSLSLSLWSPLSLSCVLTACTTAHHHR